MPSPCSPAFMQATTLTSSKSSYSTFHGWPYPEESPIQPSGSSTLPLNGMIFGLAGS